MSHVSFLLLGLGAGGVYALFSLGLVLEYRSSGVVNFAHAAMGMFIAYVFVELRTSGDLILPVVGLPDRWQLFDHGIGTPWSLAIALVYSTVLGVVVYGFVFRPLRRRPALARAVASIGLALIVEGLVVLRFGTVSRATGPLLSHQVLHLAGTIVPIDRLWLCIIAAGLGIGLWALFRFSRFGLATRAAASSEKGAALIGYSADRLALANWILATVLAGLAGILFAPLSPLDPATYTFLVVPALACALLGKLRSFPLTAVAGMALGAVQSELTHLQVSHRWLPHLALRDGLPFAVIVILMVVRGEVLPARGSLGEKIFASPRRPEAIAGPALIFSAIGVVGLFSLTGGYRGALIHSLIVALLCVSLVVLTGYCGQVSLAQMSLAGVAGFSVAKFAGPLGLPFPLTIVLAVVVAAPFGLLIGLPALRLRGVELGIVTLAGAVAMEQLVFKAPALTGSSDTAVVPLPAFLGHRFGRSSIAYGLVVLFSMVGVSIGVAVLRRRPLGRRMLAVRSSERAAAANGVSVASTKLWAFLLAAAIAGLAGTLIGYEQGQLSSDSFQALASLVVVALAYSGGIALISGALFAGVVFASGGLVATFAERHVHVAQYELLIVGLGLIVATARHDAGVASAIAGLRRPSRRKARTAGPAVAPDLIRLLASDRGSGKGLKVSALSVCYGGLRALDNVNLEVPAERIVGLIGPNGAGKTTLIDAITGYARPQAGRVVLDGEPIDGLRPDHRARSGLVRTFQFDELFEELTVWENLLVAADQARSLSASPDGPSHSETMALSALHCARVLDNPESRPSELSPASRKMVGLARALCVGPRILVLDEPSSGLDRGRRQQLPQLLKALANTGHLGILLVDHDMDVVLACSDLIYVLERGRVVMTGTPSEVRSNPDVIAVYLGADLGRRQAETVLSGDD